MAGKQFTDLTKSGALKDSDIIAVHDGNGLKKASMEDVTAYMSDKFSNPNLLINPDFKINQRGQSTYDNNYTLDRWKIYNSSINASSKTITNSNSSAGNFVQPLENKKGGTFTITVVTKSLAGTVRIKYRDGTTDKSGITLTNGINTFTFTANLLTLVGLEIGSGASVQLDYMKLEQGSIATPFVEPNISDELDRCLRYYESGSLDTSPGLAIQSTVYIRTYIHPKRINPTPKFSGAISFEMNGTGKNLSLTYIGTDLNTEICTFKFKPSEATQYGLGFCKNFAYELDSEIY